MVLCIDGDGHIALEPPHLSHAYSHAEGADHAPHDFGGDADHAGLHGLIASCSDTVITVQKIEPSTSSLATIEHHLAGLDLRLPPCLEAGIPACSAGDGTSLPASHGSTAHIELACLRSVVLLV